MPFIEDRYYRHLAQLERWRAEYAHMQAVEEALQAVGKIDYAPVDYETLRHPVPWTEPPFPSFDHILTDTVAMVNGRFAPRLCFHYGLVAVLVLMAFLWPTAPVIWFAFTGSIVTAFSAYQTWQTRHKYMVLAVDQAYLEMEQQRQAEIRRREAARLDHEKAERERVAVLEKFLAGDTQVMLPMLETALRKIELPFMVRVMVDVYGKIPRFTVFLPGREVIPPRRGIMLPSGRLVYEDKSPLTINKEYAQLCAAVLLRVAAVAYAYVPFFDVLYMQGLVRSQGRADTCLLAARFSRDAFVPALANAVNPLTAFTQAGGEAPLDAAMMLSGCPIVRPEEWGDVAARDLRSVTLDIGRGMAAAAGE